MKNIHILPTDKPSRLYLFKGRLILGDLVTVVFKNSGAINQHIYITSNEETKKEDWCYSILSKNIFKNININLKSEDKKKIILTNDTDLIKEGVQAIDDEFLEWFVKNPSCEEVGIQKQYQYHSSKEFYIDADYVDCTKEQYESIKKEIPTCPLRILYKIIIPKEEPKQETLEEDAEIGSFAEKKYLERLDNFQNVDFKDGVFEGAKYQAERMYSEEEVRKIAEDAYSMGKNNILIGVFNKWFEQFKKK